MGNELGDADYCRAKQDSPYRNANSRERNAGFLGKAISFRTFEFEVFHDEEAGI